MNRIDPHMDPCGTPICISCMSESLHLESTCWVLFAMWPKPEKYKLTTLRLWQKKSNSLDSDSGESECEDESYRVPCDGCQSPFSSKAGNKRGTCTDCDDFDLCNSCHQHSEMFL